jgi:large subunit ribosomal protein L28
MSKVCPISKKKPRFGRKYTTSGIAKKKGGIGVKITGRTNTKFNPNLKKKVITDYETGLKVRIRLSASAQRTIDKIGLAAALRKATGVNIRKANNKIAIKSVVRKAIRAAKV